MIPLAFNPNHASANNLSEMSLNELHEIALRQQQQIEINQQLLLAKEKRLNLLKLEDAKNQQLTFLTSSLLNNPNTQTNMKQNVLSQELKMFKLKQLKNQMLDFKLSNSNMYSELDLIKNLFSDKERDLYKAMNKINELNKQIEQLRRLKNTNKSVNSPQSPNNPTNQNITELERLKQELQIRNKLNEQQSKKIQQQQDVFNKKQIELTELDRRIEELKNRIKNKRNRLQSFQQINQMNQESNQENKPSPSKQAAPKFATKQEIANTYMNKIEAYQKYRMLQPQNTNTSSPLPLLLNQESINTESITNNANSNSSTSSSITSLPSPQPQVINTTTKQSTAVSSSNDAALTTLPSHLKLEFDKMKYLPDMVKTIKKRHSISEIEGSGSTIPPLIVQKILEKHKEFTKLGKINENEPPISPTPAQTQIVPIVTQNNSGLTAENHTNPPKLTTFVPQNAQKSETKDDKQEKIEQEAEQSAEQQQTVQKTTKSIIKPAQESTESSSNNNANSNNARRVNFDPHALLLDAAVEGELDLVVRCAKQVKNISEPNDEGITALHNSVCAGHFEIVKFLIEFGCDVNYADNDGWTPLHCAASCNNIQMIRYLVENGASVFASTLSDNETPIRKCEEDEDGYAECYEYLYAIEKNIGENRGTVYALYSYEKENDDELAFRCGDRLIVLDKHEEDEKEDGEEEASDGWWTCKLLSNEDSLDRLEDVLNDDKNKGLVPKNYLAMYPRAKPKSLNDLEESTMC